MKVGINAFVKRQTAESAFSHYAGTWEALASLCEAHLASGVEGYKPGVLLVTVPADGFFSGVVDVRDVVRVELTAKVVTRRDGEVPYVQVTGKGAKVPAAAVELVLYSAATLEGDATEGTEWELISINARATVEAEPITPLAMARNMLGLPGGTAATYTAEQFAVAVVYWSTRVMAE